jgi:Uncharacterized low-complexity proteins
MPGIFHPLSSSTSQPLTALPRAFNSLQDLKASFLQADNASFQDRFNHTPQDIKIELARCAIASNETELVKHLLNSLTPTIALREQILPPGSPLTGEDFSGSELSELHLPQLTFERCNLSHCTLNNNRLVRAEMQDCDLRNSTMQGTQLLAAKLVNCNLDHARLSHASLAGSRLENCSLHHCDLRAANLAQTRLLEARLSATRFEGAILDSSTLTLNNAELKQHFTALKDSPLARTHLESILNSIASIDRKYQPLKDRLFRQMLSHSPVAQGKTSALDTPADIHLVADIFTEHPDKKRFIKEQMKVFLNLSVASLAHQDRELQQKMDDLLALHSADVISMAGKS